MSGSAAGGDGGLGGLGAEAGLASSADAGNRGFGGAERVGGGMSGLELLGPGELAAEVAVCNKNKCFAFHALSRNYCIMKFAYSPHVLCPTMTAFDKLP